MEGEGAVQEGAGEVVPVDVVVECGAYVYNEVIVAVWLLCYYNYHYLVIYLHTS